MDTCYSATYMSQTSDQQRFTISEVAADWHEPMVPQRIMWPSIARANEQLILPPRGRSHTILPEYCRPLICACVLNLVRIGCGSPKGCFFRPSKSLQFRLKRCYSLQNWRYLEKDANQWYCCSIIGCRCMCPIAQRCYQ